MASSRDLPLYNLKAVVQETGIKADTLRAWERRYGIPTPRRTSSGHRLYSESDIELLHWLFARQKEGLSISRAVDLWNRMTEDGAHPIVEPPAATSLAPMGMTSHDELLRAQRETWVAACMRFDEQAAEAVLSQAFALYPPEMVCIELIQSGIAIIGDRWYRGKATVQQEHFASTLALRRLEAMLVSTPAPTRLGRILIGCPPEEEHTFVPLMLSLLLRRRGWETVYLGANIPLVSLDATIASTRPSLVILTAQQLSTAATLLEMGEALLVQRVPLAFGGLIFNRLPDLHKAIPGHFLGARLDGAVPAVEGLMANLRPQMAQRSASHEYREAFAHFRDRQATVEAAVWRRLTEWPTSPRTLAAANHHFGRTIFAALALGQLDYLSADMDWVEGLLVHHIGMPPEQLDHYLEAYMLAAEETLDQRGGPVVAWLARTLGAELSRQPVTRPRKA